MINRSTSPLQGPSSPTSPPPSTPAPQVVVGISEFTPLPSPALHTPESIDAFIKGERSRDTWALAMISLRGFDLSRVDLSGLDLSHCDLTGANLTGANLTDANLTGADLTDANLTGANLTDANLSGLDLIRANLTGANLTGANLTWANLTGANLTDANLTRADLNKANFNRANLMGATLTDANLADTYFWGAKLAGVNLSVLDLRRADLRGADLSYADLRGVNLSGLDLTRANLTGADLRGANLRSVNLTNTRLESTRIIYRPELFDDAKQNGNPISLDWLVQQGAIVTDGNWYFTQLQQNPRYYVTQHAVDTRGIAGCDLRNQDLRRVTLGDDIVLAGTIFGREAIEQLRYHNPSITRECLIDRGAIVEDPFITRVTTGYWHHNFQFMALRAFPAPIPLGDAEQLSVTTPFKSALQQAGIPASVCDSLALTYDQFDAKWTISLTTPTERQALAPLFVWCCDQLGTPLSLTEGQFELSTQQITSLTTSLATHRDPALHLDQFNMVFSHLLGESALELAPTVSMKAFLDANGRSEFEGAKPDEMVTPLTPHFQLSLKDCPADEQAIIKAWLATLSQPPINMAHESVIVTVKQLTQLQPMTDLWMATKAILRHQHPSDPQPDPSLHDLFQLACPSLDMSLMQPETVIPCIIAAVYGPTPPLATTPPLMSRVIQHTMGLKVAPFGPIAGTLNPDYLVALRENVEQFKTVASDVLADPGVSDTLMRRLDAYTASDIPDAEKARRFEQVRELLAYVIIAKKLDTALKQGARAHGSVPNIWHKVQQAITQPGGSTITIREILARFKASVDTTLGLSPAELPPAIWDHINPLLANLSHSRPPRDTAAARTIHGMVALVVTASPLPPAGTGAPQPSLAVKSQGWHDRFTAFKELVVTSESALDRSGIEGITNAVDAIGTEFSRHNNDPGVSVSEHMHVVDEMMGAIVSELTHMQRQQPERFKQVIATLQAQLIGLDVSGHCMTGLKGRVESLLQTVNGQKSLEGAITTALSQWLLASIGGYETSMVVGAIAKVLHKAGYAPPPPPGPTEYPEMIRELERTVSTCWHEHSDEIKTVIVTAISDYIWLDINDVLNQNPAGIVPITKLLTQLSKTHGVAIDSTTIQACMYPAGEYHFNKEALKAVVGEVALQIAIKMGVITQALP